MDSYFQNTTHDLAQYARLSGRTGGQTIYGSDTAGEDLTLSSNLKTTKGKINFGASAAYDENKVALGLGLTKPRQRLHIIGNGGGVGAFEEGHGIVVESGIGIDTCLDFVTFHDQYSRIIFSDESGHAGHIEYNHNFDSLLLDALGSVYFRTNGYEVARFTYDQKFGIGIQEVPHGLIGMAKFAMDGRNAHSSGPHIQYTTALDDYPLFQQMNWSHDAIVLNFDCYQQGASGYSSDAGSNFSIWKMGDQFKTMYKSGVSPGSVIASMFCGTALDTLGNFGIGAVAFGAGASKVLALYSGAAPTTSPADEVQLYSLDRYGVAGAASLHVRAEDGTTHVLGDYSGINLINPGARFCINDTTGESEIFRLQTIGDFDSWATLGMSFWDSVTRRAQIRIANKNLEIVNEMNTALKLYTNNLPWVTVANDGDVGFGTEDPSAFVDVERGGTVKSVADFIELTNKTNAADMDGTGVAIKFRQFYYDATTPAVADCAKIEAVVDNDWTSSARNSHLAFYTVGSRTFSEKARIDSHGNWLLGLTDIDSNAYSAIGMYVSGNNPSGATTDAVIVYAADSISSSQSVLGFFQEAAVAAIGQFTADYKVKLMINGWEYEVAVQSYSAP